MAADGPRTVEDAQWARRGRHRGRALRSRAVRIRGNRFLVTGAAGFIGSYVVDALIGAGAAEVVVFDAAAGDDDRAAVTPVAGDITDTAAVEQAARDVASVPPGGDGAERL
jgi:FlaA1/EpsC-like NDP-sugar epimerase